MGLIIIAKAMWSKPEIAQKPGCFHKRRNEYHCLSKVRHVNAARMVCLNRNSSDIITLKNLLRNICYKFRINPKETHKNMFRVLKNIRIKDQKNLFSSFLHVVDKKPKTNYLHSYIVEFRTLKGEFRTFP